MEREHAHQQEDQRSAFLAQHEVQKHRIGVAIIDLSTANLEAVEWQRPLDTKQVSLLADSIRRDGILHPDINRLSAIWKGPDLPDLSGVTALKNTTLGVFIGQHRAHAVQLVAGESRIDNAEDDSYEWAVELYKPELETVNTVELAAAITSDNMRRQFKVAQKVLSDREHISTVLSFENFEAARTYARSLTDPTQTLKRSIQSLVADASCFGGIQSIYKASPELVRGISGSQGKELYGWRLGALWGHIASEIVLIIESLKDFKPDGKQLTIHDLPAPSVECRASHSDGEPWCIKFIPNTHYITNDLVPRIKRTVHLAVGLDVFVRQTSLDFSDVPSGPAQVRSALKHLLKDASNEEFDQYIMRCWMQVRPFEPEIQNTTLEQLIESSRKDPMLLDALRAHPFFNSNMGLHALIPKPDAGRLSEEVDGKQEVPATLETSNDHPLAKMPTDREFPSLENASDEDIGQQCATDAVPPAAPAVVSTNNETAVGGILIQPQVMGSNDNRSTPDINAGVSLPQSTTNEESTLRVSRSEAEDTGAKSDADMDVEYPKPPVTDETLAVRTLDDEYESVESETPEINDAKRASVRLKGQQTHKHSSDKHTSAKQGQPRTRGTEDIKNTAAAKRSSQDQSRRFPMHRLAVLSWDTTTFEIDLLNGFVTALEGLFVNCPAGRRDELLTSLMKQVNGISKRLAVDCHPPKMVVKRSRAEMEMPVYDVPPEGIEHILENFPSDQLEEIAEQIVSKSVVLVVGAGISVFSGLLTFRDHRGALREGLEYAMDYAMFEANKDDCRRTLWLFAREVLQAQVKPRGHMHALISYMRRHGSGFIISTNVDELEDVPDHLLPNQYQGSPAWTPTTDMKASDNLLRLHGCVRIIQCSGCAVEWNLDLQSVEGLINYDPSPCPQCFQKRSVTRHWYPKMRFYNDPREELTDEAKDGSYRPSKRAKASSPEPSAPTNRVEFSKHQDAYQSIFSHLQDQTRSRTVLVVGSSLHNPRLRADLMAAGQAGAQIIVVNTVQTRRLTSLPNSTFINGDAEDFGQKICEQLLLLHSPRAKDQFHGSLDG